MVSSAKGNSCCKRSRRRSAHPSDRPARQRPGIVDRCPSLAESLDAGPLLTRFYSFLIDQRRLLDFEAIRTEYELLADAEAGVTKAEVRCAAPLRDDQRERLQRALAARTGGEVQLAVQVDPSLLGGVIARVGDKIFDGSLRTQLTQLRASLAQD